MYNMIYIRNQRDATIEDDTVLTLGKFDGLHRGHELLMENLFAVSRKTGLKTMVFTFDIPPNRKREEMDNRVLTTNEEKREVFAKTGLDILYECPFTTEIMTMEPKDFIQWIVTAFHVKVIVVGNDFRFGYQRKGTVETLRQFEKEYGYSLLVFDKVKEDGREISSTFIREEIKEGRLKKANHLLGYPFFVRSQVIHGKKLGRTIGIPTLNMDLPKEKLLPLNGVYVTRVTLLGQTYGAVTNVGCKPTVQAEGTVGVETHVIGFEGDVYGMEITVEFLDFIRTEKKFSSVEELKTQMQKDVLYAKNQFSYYGNVTN